MAYNIVGIDDAFGVNEIGLGADFSFNNPAIFRTVYTTNQIHTARLKTLLLTRKGERYNLPTYGSNLLDILFEPADIITKSAIKDNIIDVLSENEPRIENINILTNQDDPTLIHQIKITIEYSSDTLNAQAISINLTDTGTVVVNDEDVGTQNGNPSFGVV